MEEVYGNWMVIDGPIRSPNKMTMWLCRCFCGREKIDNDRHYEPGNLRFVTRSESQRNQRRRRRV